MEKEREGLNCKYLRGVGKVKAGVVDHSARVLGEGGRRGALPQQHGHGVWVVGVVQADKPIVVDDARVGPTSDHVGDDRSIVLRGGGCGVSWWWQTARKAEEERPKKGRRKAEERPKKG